MFRQVDCVNAVQVVLVKVKQSEMMFCYRNFVHVPGWSNNGPVNLGSGSSVLVALTVFRTNYRSRYRRNKQWSCDSCSNKQQSMVHNFHPTRIAVTWIICYSILDFKQKDFSCQWMYTNSLFYGHSLNNFHLTMSGKIVFLFSCAQ